MSSNLTHSTDRYVNLKQISAMKFMCRTYCTSFIIQKLLGTYGQTAEILTAHFFKQKFNNFDCYCPKFAWITLITGDKIMK